MLFVFLFLFGLTLAQRPGNASICDFYALSLYGQNTSATQFKLIQSIVTLAYAGGSSLPNATGITGIFFPGTFNGLGVNLQPWFDGSIPSTNLNNQGVGINWLDEGVGPLEQFLTGATPDLNLNTTSNQYQLFQNFFLAFSDLFGCTLPTLPPPSSAAILSLAYVHKFMNLTSTDIGHFIEQLSLAASYYGFSAQDAQTFNTNLNGAYNVRCAPAVNGDLNSICQASSCPLAEPSPDCEAYVDIQPNGTGNSTATSTTAPESASSTSSSSSSSSTSSQSTTSTAASSTATPSPTHLSSSSSISGGAIAGIVIGIGIVCIIVICVLVYFLRRPKEEVAELPEYTSRRTSAANYKATHQPKDNAPIAEMESPIPSPEMRKPTRFKFSQDTSTYAP